MMSLCATPLRIVDLSSSLVNVPIEVLNELAARSIEGGEPVWFGCDVGKHFHREMHVMDLGMGR